MPRIKGRYLEHTSGFRLHGSIRFRRQLPEVGLFVVDLTFATVKLRQICESRKRAMSVLGLDAARELEQVLADISASATVAELFHLYPEIVVDHRPDHVLFRFASGYEIMFGVGHINIPRTSDGKVDWAEVSRIRVDSLEKAGG